MTPEKRKHSPQIAKVVLRPMSECLETLQRAAKSEGYTFTIVYQDEQSVTFLIEDVYRDRTLVEITGTLTDIAGWKTDFVSTIVFPLSWIQMYRVIIARSLASPLRLIVPLALWIGILVTPILFSESEFARVVGTLMFFFLEIVGIYLLISPLEYIGKMYSRWDGMFTLVSIAEHEKSARKTDSVNDSELESGYENEADAGMMQRRR